MLYERLLPRTAPAPALAGRRRTPELVPALLTLVLLGAVAPAAAQPATGSASPAGGRLSVSGEASISYAADDTAWFNYATSAYSLLRQVRFDGAVAFRVNQRLSLLGDLRIQGTLGDGGWKVRPHALFARIRPWPNRAFDIQAGLVPPVFGVFGRRAYSMDDPLIGFPLSYQYLTTLRPDALPATADDLLAARGSGWRIGYSVGNATVDHGVPLVDGLNNPAGVEVRAASGWLEAAAAVTTGSLAVPNGRGVRGNAQVSGRVAVRPFFGLVLGASASRGRFLARSLTDAAGTTGRGDPNDQRAVGFDAEFSRGHWLLRSEAVISAWRVPAVRAPFIDRPLWARGVHVEGRYRLLPGLTAAARVAWLGFSEITGSSGVRLSWDAPVWRFETGGSYALRRNVVAKAAYQYNRRDTAVGRSQSFVSGQLLVWF